MHMGSKHDSEASFSFRINDAVKGNEEYLLADDDFLRDVSAYTITTPAVPSRSAVLEHEQRELTPGQTVPRTKDHGENTSYPPKRFTPSSPVFHHDGAAVNQGLKTPKPSIKFSKKASTSKITSTTLSMMKWPSPSRAKDLPRPEASPCISRLADLREEITILGESDGLYPASAPVEQQQEDCHSDKNTGSENTSPINSNMPVPTMLQNSTQIRTKASMNNDYPPIILPSPTQSTPVHEPRNLGSISMNNHKEIEPVSTTTFSVERPAGPEIQHRHQVNGAVKHDTILAEPPSCSVQSKLLSEGEETPPEEDHMGDCMGPLTISQLSPRKLVVDGRQHPSSLSMSPLRPPRKRPASPMSSNRQIEKRKKGKTADTAQKSRDQATVGHNSAVRNPSSATRRRKAAAEADRRNRCSTTKRLIRSGSGSRLRSSRMSSSGASVVVSNLTTSSISQSQNIVGPRKEGQTVKRVVDACKDTADMEMKMTWYDSSVTNDQSNESPSSPSIAPEHGSTWQASRETWIAPTSLLENLNTSGDENRNDDQIEQGSQRATTTRANTAKSLDSALKFRSKARQYEENINKKSHVLRSQTRSQRSLLATSNATSMSSSSSSSNSRSIGSMAHSQFRYSHHRPIPDFKAEHALLESSLARRKENIAPIIPLSFELHTDARAKEREKFEAAVREKEKEMEIQREVKRKEREEQEEQDLRELRRKAVPKANAVPEWYKEAPRRKRRGQETQGSESCRKR